VSSTEPEGTGSGRASSSAIFLITHSHYPHDIRTAKEAGALVEAGFSVTVFCLRRPGEPRREVSAGTDVRRLPIEHKRGSGLRYVTEYAGFFLLAGWEATRLALARRPFAVQVSNPPDFLIFATLFLKLLGARVVLDMHEPVPELYASIRGVPLSNGRVRILGWIEQLATRFADQVITVSEPCRRTFARRGTPAEKIAVVHNVCEARVFDPARFATRGGEDAALPETAGRPVFRLVTHSTLVPRYGVDLAVRAMGLLRDRIPEARLEIYGRGEARADLERLAGELGVGDRIVFGGYLDPSALPERIARAHVGLVPQRKDLFMDLVLPTKLFEFVAMEKPVVASRTAAVVEHYGSDELYLFDADDAEGLAGAVAEIHARPDEARERARRLRERCSRATWECEKAVYVAIYEAIRERAART